ncbi:MAG: ABC transporter permease [Anaerohalosphaera sp.]|nr:ABC transporter permease [Anaerohalosphaera sp.]
MPAYIIRRLLYMIPIVFGVLLLTFLLFNVVGADQAVYRLAGNNPTPEILDDIRHELGYDKPLIFSIDSQFVTHVKKAVTFNFGKALDKEPIIDKLKNGVPYSLALTVPMFFGIVVTSVSLAILAAFYRGTWFDRIILLICVAGMSFPYLSYIIFGQYFIAYKYDLFQIYFSPQRSIWSNAALPILIGIVVGIGGNVRFYRTVMLDEINSGYIRTAFAKGLSTRVVLFKHLLKNAMIPIITNTVLTLPYLCLGSLLLESFFGIPGIGGITLDAIESRDFSVISTMTFIFSILFVIFNLISDVCYAFADPRISFD